MLSDVESLAEIESGWRELAERRGNAFLTPEWLHAWWGGREAEGRAGDHLAVVAVRRSGGELAGVVPLAVEPSGRLAVAHFAGAALGDRFHPACAPEDEQEVAAAALLALEEQGPAWRALVLDRVAVDAEWPVTMAATSARRLASIRRSPAQLPFVPLAGITWEHYLARQSAGFRKRLRYLERSLGRDHQFRIRDGAGPEALRGDLAVFFELHDKRWGERGGSSLASPAVRAVLRDFAASAAQRGWLRLRLLEVDGVAVAALLGWRLGGVYSFYNSGFDPDWSKQSVGLLLVAWTIRDAIGEGASEFDMLLGGEGYKSRFTDRVREAVTITLVPSVSPARVVVSSEALARRAGRRLAGRGGAGRLLRSLGKRLPTSG